MTEQEYFDNLEAGDKVWTDCDSGFCHGSYSLITEIITKYDEDSGVPYRVICCGDIWYHGETGGCIKGALAYGMYMT
jgi:hypothetical protein